MKYIKTMLTVITMSVVTINAWAYSHATQPPDDACVIWQLHFPAVAKKMWALHNVSYVDLEESPEAIANSFDLAVALNNAIESELQLYLLNDFGCIKQRKIDAMNDATFVLWNWNEAWKNSTGTIFGQTWEYRPLKKAGG